MKIYQTAQEKMNLISFTFGPGKPSEPGKPRLPGAP